MLPLRLDQARGGQVRLPRPGERCPGLQLHLGQGQLLLVSLQPLHQLRLRQGAAVLPQHPEVVQLLRQGQPPPFSRQLLNGLGPRQPPHDLQLTRRQGGHPTQLPLQFLGRQDLHPPGSIQAPGLNDLAVQPLHRGSLDLPWSLGGHAAPQVHLQAMPPRGGQHGVRGLRTATVLLGHQGNVPPVVPGPPPVRRLRRGKGQDVGMVVGVAAPILRVDVGQRQRPCRPPLPYPSAHPHAYRLPLHLRDVGGHRRPQNLPGDLRVILQTLAQLRREGDQRLLRLAEQPPALGELDLVEVIAHGQLQQQLRGRQCLRPRVPPHLPPEIRVEHLRLHVAVLVQVARAALQPPGFLGLLEVASEILDDPGR